MSASTSRPRYYTANEVAVHNVPSDCWVSYLGKVYDLSPLCKEHAGDVLLKPIISNAGRDISHWFNPETREIKTHVHPVADLKTPYVPEGRFVHIAPVAPRSDWANDFSRPWWKEETYCIGILTSKTRRIRLLNSLTLDEQTVEVCTEETMKEIMRRYIPYNAHANSYTWKYFGHNLDMDKTLEENGILDEDEEFYELGMDEEEFLPPITLHLNDDLTEY